MWTNTEGSLKIRSAIISAQNGDIFYVDPAHLLDALDGSCDLPAYRLDLSQNLSMHNMMELKLDDCDSTFIQSVVEFGNIATVVINRIEGKLIHGEGHHRHAVCAAFDIPVKIEVKDGFGVWSDHSECEITPESNGWTFGD